MLILLVRRHKPAGCLRMRVPRGEGLATHAGLESCVAVLKFSHEALIKEPAGMVTSRIKWPVAFRWWLQHSIAGLNCILQTRRNYTFAGYL
jgi:hypothetical protein